MGTNASAWRREDGDTLVLLLHVQPGAKRTEVAGVHGDGVHAEAAREMVAESVGAQTSAETAVALATQEAGHTAVPLPGNILAFHNGRLLSARENVLS